MDNIVHHQRKRSRIWQRLDGEDMHNAGHESTHDHADIHLVGHAGVLFPGAVQREQHRQESHRSVLVLDRVIHKVQFCHLLPFSDPLYISVAQYHDNVNVSKAILLNVTKKTRHCESTVPCNDLFSVSPGYLMTLTETTPATALIAASIPVVSPFTSRQVYA